MTDKQLTHEIIGAAIAVHRELGPGLLEAVYEECLCHEMSLRGWRLTDNNLYRSSIAAPSWIVDTEQTS
jgi:GxxExxY protein